MRTLSIVILFQITREPVQPQTQAKPGGPVHGSGTPLHAHCCKTKSFAFRMIHKQTFAQHQVRAGQSAAFAYRQQLSQPKGSQQRLSNVFLLFLTRSRRKH
jgi:hypothetical protein